MTFMVTFIDPKMARRILERNAKEAGFNSVKEYLASFPELDEEAYIKMMKEKGFHFTEEDKAE